MTQRYSILQAWVLHVITVALLRGEIGWEWLYHWGQNSLHNWISSWALVHALKHGRPERHVWKRLPFVVIFSLSLGLGHKGGSRQLENGLETLNCPSHVLLLWSRTSKMWAHVRWAMRQCKSSRPLVEFCWMERWRGGQRKSGRGQPVEVGPCFQGAHPPRQESDTFQRLLCPDE